jgi:hypothetical protein
MSARERAILQRLSAERMHLPAYVALASGPSPITLRFKFKRLGLDLKREEVADLLKMVDEIEAQRMLRLQSILTRYAAVERDLPRRRVWE